jgi:N-acetylmuramoyl-L-alanine amidase
MDSDKPRCYNKLLATIPLLIFCSLTGLSRFCTAADSDWEQALSASAQKLAGDFRYISLKDVAEILEAGTYYNNDVRKAILYLSSHQVTVTAFNPFVLIDRQVLQMPVDALYFDGDIYLPVKFFVPILKKVLPANDNVSLPGKDIPDLIALPNIAGIFVEDKENGSLIRIKATETFDKSSISVRYSRRWLYVDILGGRVVESTLNLKIDDGLITQVVPFQMDQMVQLSFQLKKEISINDVTRTHRGDEIWVTVPTKDMVNPDFLSRLQADKQKWKIDRIVIDPGHGGRDSGTVGKRGTKEKTIVLAIAKKLRKLIKKNMDVDVFMTREKDEYISLKKRTRFANKKEAKLFISIHVNSNPSSRIRGVSTYFLGPHKTQESLEVARMENSVIKYDPDLAAYEELTQENIILATMAQNSYNKESQDFAAMLQSRLKKQTGLKDRGIKQAGFYVLWGASMPNVLIETAFMSNSQEEQLLKSSSFQDKVAQGIFESIKAFKQKYEAEINAN